MAVKTRRYSARDVTVLVIGLGMAIIVNVGLIWGPTLASVGLSATDWNGIGPIEWVGGQNYHDLAAEYPPFWSAVRNNVLWLGFLGLVATPFGLLCAVLLDRRLRLSRVYQSALYTPVVLSLAVVGFIAQLVYSSDYGVLNAVTGLTVDWLGDSSINIWVVMIAAGWRHVGYVMVIYLAGLKAVDPALKEAAAIDGADERQAFFRVVFPTLRPVNVIVLVITVIEALRAFDIIFALKKPPGTQVLGILVRDNLVGEGGGKVGLGSAYGVILLLLCLVFIIWYLVNNYRENEA
jgi:multiple sugar transport system permease protein